MRVQKEFPTIETERLILRQHCLTDATAVLQLFADPQVTEHYLVHPFTKLSQAEAIVQKRIDRWQNGHGIRWAITRKGEDSLLGSCGFNKWHLPGEPFEIGYELKRPYWNQGIMTEAITASVHYGFTIRHMPAIEAWIIPENIASARVLQKVGFQSQGIQKAKGYFNGGFYDLEHFLVNKNNWATA